MNQEEGNKGNSKAFDSNIWTDKFPIYETGETVAGAGLQWELEFDFGCLLIQGEIQAGGWISNSGMPRRGLALKI